MDLTILKSTDARDRPPVVLEFAWQGGRLSDRDKGLITPGIYCSAIEDATVNLLAENLPDRRCCCFHGVRVSISGDDHSASSSIGDNINTLAAGRLNEIPHGLRGFDHPVHVYTGEAGNSANGQVFSPGSSVRGVLRQDSIR